MSIAKTTRDKQLIGYTYHSLGYICNRKSLYRESVSYLDTAIRLYREINYELGLAQALSSFGLSNWRLAQYDKSIIAYNEILSMPEREELKRPKLGALINSGLIYEEQLRNKKAIATYQKALIIAKNIEDRYGQMICYNNISSLYRFRKEFKNQRYIPTKQYTLPKN